MKDQKDLEALIGKSLTKQEVILFDLFKNDERDEFYVDDNNNLAARLKTH